MKMIPLLLVCAQGAGGSTPEGLVTNALPPGPASNALARAAEYSAAHGGRAFLVQVGGRVIYERYDGGWSADRPHPLASGTKSFAGVLAMLAVQDGLVKLDEPAANVLTEWREDPQKSKITLRHLLQLNSGLPGGDRELSGPRTGSRLLGWAASNRASRLGLTTNTVEPANKGLAALSLPLAHEPGTTFDYGPSHFYVVALLLQRRLEASERPERNVLQYLHRRLLEPIGISNARIARDRAGNPDFAGGMMLTAREWAKFGQFVADRGAIRREDGILQPWLNPELLEECFKPSAPNPLYGLTWWLPTAGEPDVAADTGVGRVRRRLVEAAVSPITDAVGRPVTVWMAAGLGKQRLYVLPDRGWVIVRFGDGSRESVAYSDAEVLRMLLESDRPPSASSATNAAAPRAAPPL